MASSNQHEHLTLHKGWQGTMGGGGVRSQNNAPSRMCVMMVLTLINKP